MLPLLRNVSGMPTNQARVGGLREDALQLDQVQPEHVAGSHSIVLDVHYQSELLMESQVRNNWRAESSCLDYLTNRGDFPLQPFSTL